MKKAHESAQAGAVVVCLPAKTDTQWWHDYVLPVAEVRYMRCRMKLNGIENSAPFPECSEATMLAIIGKATPNKQIANNEPSAIELFLNEFEVMLNEQGRFVYAWSFNPDKTAIDCLRQTCDRHEEVFLYLPKTGGLSDLRMRIVDFYHDGRTSDGTKCPDEWTQYCIKELRDIRAFRSDPPGAKPIRLWFLVDKIEHLCEPVNLRIAFKPVFVSPPKYKIWKQNSFAFLRPT